MSAPPFFENHKTGRTNEVFFYSSGKRTALLIDAAGSAPLMPTTRLLSKVRNASAFSLSFVVYELVYHVQPVAWLVSIDLKEGIVDIAAATRAFHCLVKVNHRVKEEQNNE